ncbi:MAG: type II secretion system F family protein [Polyangia bacterium]|jgi:type IV pilus assembly protein PilC|nr:type II secretion system F family protein [Polyangia bacterium]
MPTFIWEGRNRTGELRKGESEAENEQALAANLRLQQITLQRAKKKSSRLNLNISIGTGVKTKDLVVFTRQFATMIDAGLPLVQCLDILGNTTNNKRFGKILTEVKGTVEGGETFSKALARHPKVFDNLFVNLVAAGEAGGIIDTIMNRLAIFLEKHEKLKRRIKSAMTYPAAIVIIISLIMTVLLLKVIPTFEKMFKDLGNAKLPAPTRIMISLSHGFATNLPYIIVFVILLVVGYKAFVRWPKGKYIKDTLVLGMPIIGVLVRKSAVARFSRTLGTLLSSGVPILDAMEIVAKTAGNSVVERAVMFSRERISEGKDMVTPLSESKVFPPMVIQMIGVGEQTGALDNMLQKVADFYEDEVDVAVDGLTSLLEPIMMVVLGSLVGGVIISMYLPIFSLAGAIKAN